MLHIKSKPIRKQNRKNDDTSGVSLPERVNLSNVCNTANQPKNHIPVIVTRAFQLGDSLHGLFLLLLNGIDKRTMDQLRHNRNVTALTLEKMCRILSCTANDVLSFKNEI